jgi:hypothetical protein
MHPNRLYPALWSILQMTLPQPIRIEPADARRNECAPATKVRYRLLPGVL